MPASTEAVLRSAYSKAVENEHKHTELHIRVDGLIEKLLNIERSMRNLQVSVDQARYDGFIEMRVWCKVKEACALEKTERPNFILVCCLDITLAIFLRANAFMTIKILLLGSVMERSSGAWLISTQCYFSNKQATRFPLPPLLSATNAVCASMSSQPPPI